MGGGGSIRSCGGGPVPSRPYPKMMQNASKHNLISQDNVLFCTILTLLSFLTRIDFVFFREGMGTEQGEDTEGPKGEENSSIIMFSMFLSGMVGGGRG